jgi:hypothetical protein
MYNRRLTWAITCAALFALLSTALPAAAQMVASGPNAAPSVPYTVEFRTTRVQTLANGATITRETREVMARDSEGRTMNASTHIPSRADQPEFTFTNAHDPVANTQANWDSNSKRAHVVKMPPTGSQGCWSSNAGNTSYGYSGVVAPGGSGGSGVTGSVITAMPAPPPPVPLAAPLPDIPARVSAPAPAPIHPQREDIGTDTILGVEVRGERITRTTPAGRIGNDEPLVRTEEIWSAPSLGGLVLRETTDDPQMGKSTREAVNLDLNEPDPAVFAPPEGYEVIDQEMHPVPCQSPH